MRVSTKGEGVRSCVCVVELDVVMDTTLPLLARCPAAFKECGR